MSERVGAIRLGTADSEVFLGRDMGHPREYSEAVADLVDEEVRRLIDSAHDEAWQILNEYRHVLDSLATELLERETLNQQELAEVFVAVVKRDPRPVWLSSEDRPVSDIPPVQTPVERAQGDRPMVPQDEAAAAGDQAPAGPIAPGGAPAPGVQAPGDAGTPSPYDQVADGGGQAGETLTDGGGYHGGPVQAAGAGWGQPGAAPTQPDAGPGQPGTDSASGPEAAPGPDRPGSPEEDR